MWRHKYSFLPQVLCSRTRSQSFSSFEVFSPWDLISSGRTLCSSLPVRRNQKCLCSLLACVWILGVWLSSWSSVNWSELRRGCLSGQKMLVLRRCWLALFSEPELAFLCPCWEPSLSSLILSYFSVALFSFLSFSHSTPFFYSFRYSPVELRTRGPKVFSFLSVCTTLGSPVVFISCEGKGQYSAGGDLRKVGGMSQEWEIDVEILCDWAKSGEWEDRGTGEGWDLVVILICVYNPFVALYWCS